MTSRWRSSLPAVAVLVLAAGALLSGCGVADSAARPGAAAVVNGTSISIGEVDDLAGDLCGFLDSRGGAADGAEQQVLSGGEVRSQVVQLLAQRAAAEQFLADYDAEPYAEYERAVAENDQANASLPAGQRAALGVANEASIYHQAALLSVGIELLGGSSDDLEAAGQRGAAAFAEWLADQDVTINPMFGVAVDEGAFVAAETTELSVPVSGEAAPSAAALPDDQTCG